MQLKNTVNSNLILICVSVVILFVVASYDVNFLNYQAPMPYASWAEITWNDFKGRNKPYHTLDGEDKIAFISTQIKADYAEDGNIRITTYFHPSRSYVYSQNILDNALLEHELYHLHITEAIARRMRNKISESQSKEPIDLSQYLSTFLQKEDSMQRAYDTETYHGYVLNRQKMWQKTVDNYLLSLEKFSNPVVKLN